MSTPSDKHLYAERLMDRAETLVKLLHVAVPHNVTITQIGMIVETASDIFGDAVFDEIKKRYTQKKAKEKGLCIECLTARALPDKDWCVICMPDINDTEKKPIQ